jgi:hypothetical protein
MEEVIGVENANTFMELATPRDWDDIVRVYQLDAAIGSLRVELTSEIGDVRLEIANLRTDMRTGFAEARTEIAGLRTEMTGLIAAEIRRQTQWIIGVLTSLSVALIAATVF